MDEFVQYVGLASRSLRNRLSFYRRSGKSQRTNVRLNGVIRAQLETGATVKILIAEPADSRWNGLPIRGPEGLEAGLIDNFNLPWNLRASMVEPPEVTSTVIEDVATRGLSFYVYDNKFVDKAIVHRGNCSFCNDGVGLHGSPTTKSSTWHGPYPSGSAALAKAKSCGRARTEGCSVCSPL